MSPTVLNLETPAKSWREALPCGNGAVGALVYGRVASERILFNHEALWSKGRTPPVPATSGQLGKLRAMLETGRFAEAETFFPQLWESSGFRAESAHFLPGPDLRIESQPAYPFEKYASRLDMDSGEITVSWKENGYLLKRRMFVSRADRVAVIDIRTENPDGLDLRFFLRPHDPLDSLEYGGFGGVCPPEARYVVLEDTVRMEASFSDGTSYAAEVKICAGDGCAEGSGLRVLSRARVTVLVRLAPVGDSLAAEWPDWPDGMDYDALLAAHLPLHAGLMSRLAFSLGGSQELSNERMLLETGRSPVPSALLEKLFHYGRYLMVCSSTGQATYPGGLQGIWNGDYRPAWTGGYFIDENIQMSYWQAMPGGLPEAMLPFFNFFEQCLDDFRENARRVYGCRGILLPLFMSPRSGRKHNPQPHCVYWTAGAGWIAQHFFDYYLYTGDEAFLAERALPFMLEAVQFYEDFFIEGENGCWVSAPSMSPENCPLGDFEGAGTLRGAMVNATMDFAVARELFMNLIEGSRILGVHQEHVEQWGRFLEKIPAYRINEDGAICEWIDERLQDNDHHRHLSHVYPLFPGRETCRLKNPGLFDACRKAVEKRLVIGIGDQTGWSLAHMASIYARLKEGNKALECIRLLTRSCLGKNFLTYHNSDLDMGITKSLIHGMPAPFQVDANFGVTAALLEMLLFSRPGEIHLLPALPDAWPEGAVRGLRAMGGAQIDMQWNPISVSISLSAKKDQAVTVYYRDQHRSVDLTAQNPAGIQFRTKGE